jgi:lipopolysaccharide transport system ATP-binding protein
MMDNVIELENVSKTYRTYQRGWDQLKEIMTGRTYAHLTYALHPLNLNIHHGQVVGLVGKNGAGKSTLLKLVARTLTPDLGGYCRVHGRVAALLELGGGFHPEMTGRENVYLSGAVMGLTLQQIDELYDEIVAFAGIADDMERPVKTYSSGMFVRLAFAVATCIEPDVLIVDEALSVGDGAFARKSFDRIMHFRESAKTILFCSHSLYQMEKICDTVLWLDHGQVKAQGDPNHVLTEYAEFLNHDSNSRTSLLSPAKINTSSDSDTESTEETLSIPTELKGTARLTQIVAHSGAQSGTALQLHSGESELTVTIEFIYDPTLATPTVGVAVMRRDGLLIASATTHNDDVLIPHHNTGKGKINLLFPRLLLLKGNYQLDVYLGCEKALHAYDQALSAIQLEVVQHGVEQGIVAMPHRWQLTAQDHLLSL